MSNMAVNELRLQLDELATGLLLNGAGASLSTGLTQFAAAAEFAGFVSVAQIASGLAVQIASGDPTSDNVLRDGFARLQAALQSPESDTAATCSTSAGVADQSFTFTSLAQDPELVGDFILESREHLTTVENHMLTLERNPEDKEAVHAVFRAFHTIKGLAGFLEFTPIREVAHEIETLLDDARNGKLSTTGSVVDVVLESVDYLKHSIQCVENSLQENAAEPIGENLRLIARIRALSNTDTVPEAAALAPALTKLAESIDPAVLATDNVQTSAVIRVQTAKLDYLMDMVGEMVITQSLIRHNPAISTLQNAKLMADISQLARITSEVQRTTMGMRMITLSQVFQRSTRLIRDLSRKQGKQIHVEVSGEETEVDKAIAEELTGPLLHMVRNACDHGVDTAEERRAAGKPAVATVKLAAYHQGGQIVIEIADDGRGLNREKLLAKALEKRLIEPNAQLSDQEVFNLIFEPGFSTAAQVTDVSGRGVGMDVVRKNITKLRGRIDIQSKQGQGTTFFLRLPLTLAIIEGLVVGVGVHRYIIPIYAVRELISPRPEMFGTVHGHNETALVRNQILPVLRLSRRFNVKSKSDDPCQGLLIVTECQKQPFCLLVDQVIGKQEVVIKSLGATLTDIPGIAGGAILGDGRVSLILDPEGIFRGSKQ